MTTVIYYYSLHDTKITCGFHKIDNESTVNTLSDSKSTLLEIRILLELLAINHIAPRINHIAPQRGALWLTMLLSLAGLTMNFDKKYFATKYPTEYRTEPMWLPVISFFV